MDPYTTVRLHSGIGYVTPRGRLHGRDQAIWEGRRRRLGQAQLARRAARQVEVTLINTAPMRGKAVLALPQWHEAKFHFMLNPYNWGYVASPNQAKCSCGLVWFLNGGRLS